MFEKPLETENKKIMNYKLTELENYLNSDVFVYFGSLLSNADNVQSIRKYKTKMGIWCQL